MSQITMQDRLNIKTPESAFLHVLCKEFSFSKRVAREVLNAVQETLRGSSEAKAVRPGQIRLVVASMKAPFGPPLSETDKVEVTLTVDTGAEDAEVKQGEGVEAQRQGRILRLLEEALEQGGVLTQEDLARALSVNRRTIIRDVKALKAAEHLVNTRGRLKGVGRGQSHKVAIVKLYLQSHTYEYIQRRTRHSLTAIKRYITWFGRVVLLHRRGLPAAEIAFMLGISQGLVEQYLELLESSQGVEEQAVIADLVARLSGSRAAAPAKKKGGGSGHDHGYPSVWGDSKANLGKRYRSPFGNGIQVTGQPPHFTFGC